MHVVVLLLCSENILQTVLLHRDKRSFHLGNVNIGDSTVSEEKATKSSNSYQKLRQNNENDFCKNTVPNLGDVLLECKRMDGFYQVDSSN